MTSKTQLWIGIALAFAFVSCGQGTEPLSTLGSPTQANGPGLSFPVPLNSTFSLLPYSSSTNGLVLENQVVTTQVKAPASGLVVSISSGSSSITIQHTVHVASVITNINIGSVQVGTYVSTGQYIGNVSFAGNLTFSVLVDGVYVCPFSYLSSAARQSVYSTYSGSFTNPCIN